MTSTRPFYYPAEHSSLHCGSLSVAALAKEFGTPLYLYSADHILERLQLFAEAFEDRPHLVCYSVKANSALAILKLMADKGAGFDIVSGGELQRVLAVSEEAVGRVVFSGVGKTAAEMDLALNVGILIFNVESGAELTLLAERARKQKKPARIALRVNPDVFAETHPYISTGLSDHKFGVAISKARALYRIAAEDKWLRPCGVSVHIGSQIRSAEPFGAAMERVVKLVGQLRKDGIAIESVDAGGGLGIEYSAEGGFDADPKGFDPKASAFDPKVRIGQYAAALRSALDALPDSSNLQLLLEPGRFLVAQAGALVARVLYVKKNGKKTFVVTDAGMNDLIRPALYHAHHEIVAVAPRPGKSRIVDVVGPVCESGDFFARDRELPHLEAGDLVAVLDAGAYGMSLSSNYNTRPRPAEVLLEGSGARLMRRRETMQDLLRPELNLR